MRIIEHLGRKFIACQIGIFLALVGTVMPGVSDAKFLAACGVITTLTTAYMTTNAIASRGQSATTESTESVVVTRKEAKQDGAS